MIYQFGSQREMRAASAESWHPVTGFKETATCPLCHHIASEPHPINQIKAMDTGTYHKYLQRALVHVRISSWAGWVARQCNYRHYRHLNGKGPQATTSASRWMGEERGLEAPLKRGTITQPMRWLVYPLRICQNTQPHSCNMIIALLR